MTDKHLPTKNRPENATLRRRFAAEEWAMPEDGPPMEGARGAELRFDLQAPAQRVGAAGADP